MQYKFYLKSEQQAPSGTTSMSMTDGGIVWIGDKWEATYLDAHEMTKEEIQEYNDFIEYQKAETEFHISFENFRDSTKLVAIKSEITSKLSSIVAPIKNEIIKN